MPIGRAGKVDDGPVTGNLDRHTDRRTVVEALGRFITTVRQLRERRPRSLLGSRLQCRHLARNLFGAMRIGKTSQPRCAVEVRRHRRAQVGEIVDDRS